MTITPFLSLIQGEYHLAGVSLKTIAETVGTPCYVYSRTALETHFKAFATPFKEFPHQINYAVKANSNLAVLNILANLGSGFDIVSEGELERVLKAKGSPKKIIFSGVGKTRRELERALEVGVGCINIESAAEMDAVNKLAIILKKKVNIAIRVNPDIDAKSHPYISTGLKENKFGVDLEEAFALYLRANSLPGLTITGIACHIGSQITSLSPFLAVLDKLLAFKVKLEKAGITIQHLNLGGGLGVCYHDETPPNPEEYVKALVAKIKERDITLFLEPGRAIAANAGVLLTRVQYLKPANHDQGQNFAIVDAGMNDLLRPALYHAWQEIVPVSPHQAGLTRPYDIVGPVCETSDFLGKRRELCLKAGDLLMVCGAGAYGFSMSSNYNSRPRAAEVMIEGTGYHIVRKREEIADLFALEALLPP
jgi:diaminopimelate decarboxylase